MTFYLIRLTLVTFNLSLIVINLYSKKLTFYVITMIICIIMIDYDLPKHDLNSYVAVMGFEWVTHNTNILYIFTYCIVYIYWIYTICEYIHIVYILVTFIHLPFHYIMNVMQFPIWRKSEHTLMYIHVVIMTKNIRFLTKYRCALNLVGKNFLVKFFWYCSQNKKYDSLLSAWLNKAKVFLQC